MMERSNRFLVDTTNNSDYIFEKGLVHKVLLLHAVAVAVDNKAYLLFAPPSGGKSTMAYNWKKQLGGRVVIIADDSPAIGIEGRETFVWNSC